MAMTRKFTRDTTVIDGVPHIRLEEYPGEYIPIVRKNYGNGDGLSRTELVSVAYKVLGGSGHAKVTDAVLLGRIWATFDRDYSDYTGTQELEGIEDDADEPRVSTRNTDADQVLKDLRKVLGSGVDEETITRIVEQKIQEYVSQPKVVQVAEHEPVRVEGPTHFKFETLLRKMSARRNLFLEGPAGTGKTKLTSQCAKALGLDYKIMSAKPLPQDYEAFGYLNTSTGRKVMGFIEELYENGGVFVLDEVDTGHASLMTMLNQILAQDEYDFPCEVNGTRKVQRHKDFMVMATGNTYGQGGSLRYVGTNKMNGAGLDRFTFVHIPTDEQLEKIICDAIEPSYSALVVPIVRKARANCDKYALDYMVTPRCSIDMVLFMKAGDSLRESAEGRLFGRGLGPDAEAKLLEGISL